MDERPKRIKKFAFTIVFVWTGPKGADLINAGVFDIPFVVVLIRPTGLTFVKVFSCILPMAAWLERLISIETKEY